MLSARLDFKSIIQIVAGLVFTGLGLYIMLTKFENNAFLIGSTKYFYGGIVCLYGLVRLGRVYLNKKSKNEFYENPDS